MNAAVLHATRPRHAGTARAGTDDELKKSESKGLHSGICKVRIASQDVIVYTQLLTCHRNRQAGCH